MLRIMIPSDVMAALSLADGAALLVLVLAWGAIGWSIEHPRPGRPSVTMLMAEVRREWMREVPSRDNRIFDAQILASLRQGTTFLASTSLIAIGGVLALIGNIDPLAGIASEIAGREASRLLWQLRLVPAALFLTHAFLKLIWADRVFGYCAVMLAAVPMDGRDPRAAPRAARAADLNVRAAMNYNRGLRSIYFALGSLAWLAGPVPLGLAALAVTASLWRREFASVPRDILAQG